MKLVVNIEDRRHHITVWLTLWQAGSNITPRELELLIEVLLRRDELIKDVKEPYLSQMLFNTDSRRSYCSLLEISAYNLTNMISSLKSKGVIDDGLVLTSNLIPDDVLEIRFKND